MNSNAEYYLKEIAKQLLEIQIKHDGIPSSLIRQIPREFKKFIFAKAVNGRKKYFISGELRKKVKIVMTGGVFDVLHYGHVYTLVKAKSHGDMLVVVVARDENVEKWKGKRPIHNQDYRREMVEQLKPVDVALVGGKDRMETFNRILPDVVVFGYDQAPFAQMPGCKSVKLKTPINDRMFKSSKIKEHMGV